MLDYITTLKRQSDALYALYEELNVYSEQAKIMIDQEYALLEDLSILRKDALISEEELLSIIAIKMEKN